jgi:hypothetical protein
MSLIKLLWGSIYKKYAFRHTLQKQIEMYHIKRKQSPDQAQHMHLAEVWLSRRATFGMDPFDESIQARSYVMTFLYACLPHPVCAEALGLYTVLSEYPERVINRYPEFMNRYKEIMNPFRGMAKPDLKELYLKHNKNTPDEFIDTMLEGDLGL